MVLGSTQVLKEMSTRNLPGGKGRPGREPVAASKFHNPTGLHGLLQGWLYLLFLLNGAAVENQETQNSEI
jgi:hypothetical protein